MSDSAKPPAVSAVITVYNKEPYLADTIRSLRRQTDDERAIEYVFVDDASTDRSIAVIKKLMADAPNVRIIENGDNKGPSIRLNQGARTASGELLYFLDADDIATRGALNGMAQLLEREKADVIYGKTEKQRAASADLFGIVADPEASYTVADEPLAYIMRGGFVRMTLMCRRGLFLKAGGADERIFVQDESLPLRLCAHAGRFIDWQATVIAMPMVPAALRSDTSSQKISGNKSQLHHDAFMAYLNILDDTRESHPDLASDLYAKAVSAYWKFARRKRGPAWLYPGFWRYLQAKSLDPSPRPNVLAWMKADLLSIPDIRRP